MKLLLCLVVIVAGVFGGGQASAYLGYCSEPTEPSCVDMLGLSRDQFFFDMCRNEIETYLSDIDDYIACRVGELEDERRDLNRKADEYIERFNCYARGEDFCF